MNREDLAEEIRGVGFALRYADGPVIGGSLKSKKPVSKQLKVRKLKESDWTIIRRASTCFTCRRRASDSDIKEAIEMASDYKSFARQIWMGLEHRKKCDYYEADSPYMEVSEKAKTKFTKARKKWTKKIEKKARKQATKSSPKNPKPGSK